MIKIKKEFTALVLLGIVFFQSCFGKEIVPSEKFMRSITSDEYDDETFKLFWEVKENNDIVFEAHCKTTGWISIGISPDGKLPNSDIAIGWVDKSGKAYIIDTNTIKDKNMPLTDKHQDWILIEGREENGYTIIKFKRNVVPCDKEEDLEIKFQTNYIIFGYSDKDPVTGNNDWYDLIPESFTNRPVSILAHELETFTEEEIHKPDILKFDVGLQNHPVSSSDTEYWCKYFEFPDFGQDKVSIIGYDLMIERKNLDLVHHILVFECDRSFLNGKPLYERACGNVGYPMDMNKCINKKKVFGWGKGGLQKTRFPKDKGISISKAGSDKIYLYEVHYDNPQKLDGIYDSTHARFYFSKQLVSTEIGIFHLTTSTNTLNLIVPPKTTNFTTSSFVESEILSKFIPDEGIYFYSAFLHTHTIGKKIKTIVLNEKGEVVQNLFSDENYDFDAQFYQGIKPFHFKKGYSFFLECNYDTMNRDKPAYWGFESYNEMCMSYMYYYPLVEDFDICLTYTNYEEFMKFLTGLQNDNLIPSDVAIDDSRQLIDFFTNRAVYTDELKQRLYDFHNSEFDQTAVCGTTPFLPQDLYPSRSRKPSKYLKEEPPQCQNPSFALNSNKPGLLVNMLFPKN